MSAKTSRKRTRPVSIVRDLIGTYYYNAAPQSVLGPIYESRKQETYDNIHSDYPKSGGDFISGSMTTTFDVVPSAMCGQLWNSSFLKIYNGQFQAVPQPIYDGYHYHSESLNNWDECSSFGAQAWNRFKPGKPVVSLGQAIAELKDTPQLLFKRIKKFRDLGGNYLALEFGWKPFLRDIFDLLKSIKSIDKQVAQLKRDNGVWIRRKGILFTDEDEDNYDSPIDGGYMLYPNNAATVSTFRIIDKYKLSIKSTRTCSFSGKFRYYIPGLKSQKWGDVSAIQRLWGLELDPELLYELFPYSWLADWYSNLGDVISNLCSDLEDHLVAKYAYVMLHTKKDYVAECDFKVRTMHNWTKDEWFSYYAKTSTHYDLKSRATASPFGFNLNLPDLSAWQKSILIALGISRLKI
jgi:hypothetical protein